MAPLVEKLSQGNHPIALIRYKDPDELREAIDRGYVLVKFTDTQGGTEIGMALDEAARKVEISTGAVDLCGSLTLDYQPVKCLVIIDLATMSGQGRLEPVQPV